MDSQERQNYIPQVSVDCVIFGYRERQLNVLVARLIFNGEFYALPGGFVYQDEDLDQAAVRVLADRTGIKEIYLEQFRVFGDATRNSKSFLNQLIELNPERLGEKSTNAAAYDWFTRRFISVGYYALVDIEKVVPQKTDLDQSIAWYNLDALPEMIIDHQNIVSQALKALRSDLHEKLNGFNLLPEKFTMKEVQELYETIFDKSFVRGNFQKMILSLDVLERLEKKFTGAANKAPYWYRFRK